MRVVETLDVAAVLRVVEILGVAAVLRVVETLGVAAVLGVVEILGVAVTLVEVDIDDVVSVGGQSLADSAIQKKSTKVQNLMYIHELLL